MTAQLRPLMRRASPTSVVVPMPRMAPVSARNISTISPVRQSLSSNSYNMTSSTASGKQSHPQQLTRSAPTNLATYSWDLGTCVPFEVLKPRGTVLLNNPSLRSLSLTTNPNCHRSGGRDCEVDLYPLRQLQSYVGEAPALITLRLYAMLLKTTPSVYRVLSWTSSPGTDFGMG